MTQETKYPAAARELQKSISEGLPETERADWHAAFSEKAETVTDWQIVIDKTVLASLRIAEPHDTSESKVVAMVIGLYERRLSGDDPIDAEWYAAWDAAVAAQAVARAAWATRASAWAARAAARDDEWPYSLDDELAAAGWRVLPNAAWAAGEAAQAAQAAKRASDGANAAWAAGDAAWVQIRDAFLNA